VNVYVTVAVPPALAEPLKPTPGIALPEYVPLPAENVYAPVPVLGGVSNEEKLPFGTLTVSVPLVGGAGNVTTEPPGTVPERGPATEFIVADKPAGAPRVSGIAAVAFVKL